jgi:hypothetical protein
MAFKNGQEYNQMTRYLLISKPTLRLDVKGDVMSTNATTRCQRPGTDRDAPGMIIIIPRASPVGRSPNVSELHGISPGLTMMLIFSGNMARLGAGQKNRYTQSAQSCLDAIFLGQIEPELKKTKWNKISDFLSLFLANRTRI